MALTIWRTCSVEDNRLDNSLLEQWIILLGEGNNFKKGSKRVSSRQFGVQFKNRQACLWRFLKWPKGTLKRTSTFFYKIHLVIALPLRAIVALFSPILVVTLTIVKPSEYCGKNSLQRF